MKIFRSYNVVILFIIGIHLCFDSLHPKYDLAMNNLANIYRDEGNFKAAETLLTKALEIRPDFSTAWMNLGIVYSSMGVLNESEYCYLEALKHRKRYPDCYYNLGNLVKQIFSFPPLLITKNCDSLGTFRIIFM